MWLFWGKKEEWKLVKSLTEEYWVMNKKTNDIQQEHELFFHLFESKEGKRKVQIRTTLAERQDVTDNYGKTTPLYNKKIYRWLTGRLDPDIPRFGDIEQEEVVHILKGTIEETP